MSFERIAENRIQEAVENGEFDHLPGKGKPLDLDAYFATPAEMRPAHSVMKNAKFVPEELQLFGEAEALKEQIEGCADEAERARLRRLREEKLLKFNLLAERRKAKRRG
jgi:hypothetical protein